MGPTEYDIGIDALLESDISSFEYFNTLSDEEKRRIKSADIGSFEEMQQLVVKMKNGGF